MSVIWSWFVKTVAAGLTQGYISPLSPSVGFNHSRWLIEAFLRLCHCLSCYGVIYSNIAIFFSATTEWPARVRRAIHFIWQEIHLDSVTPPFTHAFKTPFSIPPFPFFLLHHSCKIDVYLLRDITFNPLSLIGFLFCIGLHRNDLDESICPTSSAKWMSV